MPASNSAVVVLSKNQSSKKQTPDEDSSEEWFFSDNFAQSLIHGIMYFLAVFFFFVFVGIVHDPSPHVEGNSEIRYYAMTILTVVGIAFLTLFTANVILPSKTNARTRKLMITMATFMLLGMVALLCAQPIVGKPFHKYLLHDAASKRIRRQVI